MSDSSHTKQVCPECRSEEDWRGASWCPACGYYPALNRQVESTAVVDEEQVYEHWWQVIPGWLWSLAAGSLAIFGISVAVRVMFAESSVRVWWTFGQMGLGIVVMCSVHFMAYLYGVARSDKLGPLDMFMRPIATWQPVFAGLPGSSHLVCLMGFSVVALTMGYFVIDGVDYVAIMQADAAARKREQERQAALDAAEGKKKTSAMGMMIQTASGIAQAKNAMSPNEAPPETLEDALTSFAGEAGVIGEGGLVENAGAAGTEVDGLGGAMAGVTEIAGGVDVDEYLQQQQAIADGEVPAGQDPGSALDPTTIDVAGGELPDTGGQSPVSAPATPSPGRSAGGPVAGSNTGAAASRPREEIECLILGYTTNSSGEIRSLLLAAAPDRKLLRFVAKVPVEQVDPDQLNLMLQQFDAIPARQPLVRCPFGGRWVLPEMFCIATFDGWTADNRLHNASVQRLTSNTEN